MNIKNESTTFKINALRLHESDTNVTDGKYDKYYKELTI